TYIDTHSGAGVYALDEKFAAKTAESETGIGKLWDRKDMPPALKEYVDLIKGMNPSGKLRYYPGSPYCAHQVAREHDRLRLFEMHPADVRLLADNFNKIEAHAAAQGVRPTTRGKRVMIERSDGFASLKSLLPPPSRRSLVLIDPPYEDKNDYRYVKDALELALGRFPAGVYAVWYPLLQRMESRQFADKLKRLPAKEWLNVTLTTRTPGPDGVGLHSSGMFVLNPPFTLEATLREVMPYLVKVLGTDAGATFAIEKGTQVTGAAGARIMPDGTIRTPRNNPVGKGSLRVPGQAPEGTPVPKARAGAASGRPVAPGRPAAASGRPVAGSGRPVTGAERPSGTSTRSSRPRVAAAAGAAETPAAPRGGRTRR
ncbi:MAG TPA: 23S rRNA (adenine(2030)-N(6))-methyltransferase RlmJ, partial [Telluria sp.]|nr:23S rRNA (adenine(2030)-N(6))-methyltransferase RlmJ [Telluria sp.]